MCSRMAAKDTLDEGSAAVIKDAHGAILADGDTVVVIKDLKLKAPLRSLKVAPK